MMIGGRFFALLVLAGIALASACAGEAATGVAAALPVQSGLAVEVVGARVDAVGGLELHCELRNSSGATLRINEPKPVTEEKSSTTVSTDGKVMTTRTSRSTRLNFAMDGWQVTFRYRAGEAVREMVNGLTLPSAFAQPLDDGGKRQVALVLAGAGRFTQEFFAAVDEVRIGYTPSAPLSDKMGAMGLPTACAVRIGGDDLRKLMAAAAVKR